MYRLSRPECMPHIIHIRRHLIQSGYHIQSFLRALQNKYVCYECGSYFRVRTKNRIRMVADAGTFEPWFEYLESENPLDFPEYTQINQPIDYIYYRTHIY